MTNEIYITKINDHLDIICYDYYGTTDNDIVIKVLEANPGLERQGIILDRGIRIVFPDIEPASTDNTLPKIDLW